MSRCDEQKFDVWDESELKNEIQFYASSFILTDKDKEKMWNTIRDTRGKKSYAMVKRMFRISAAVFVCVVLFGIGINAASNGRVAEVILKFCGMQQESVQIIGNMTPESENFAPPLLFCDQSYVIFANSRGMVIYNRERKKVTATIDLQEISCNYFTADTLMTKVIVEGKKIIVFNVQVEGKESTVLNEKNKKVQGDSYVFELAESPEPDTILCLKPVEKTKDESLPERWEKKMSGCYVDTFEELEAETIERWHKEEKLENLRYSEESVRWSSEKGEIYISCLLTKESGYRLYTLNTVTGESEIELLSITLSEEAIWQNEVANTLPKYVYTGKDMKMKAICDYLVEHETEEEEYPLIPVPLIYDTIKEDGVWKVFGNFWYFYYYKNGNTLEEKGGSEMPACFHLKKVHGAYTVVKVERPRGGGAKYVEGIRKFCKGHPEVYKKFFRNAKDIDKRDKIQKKQIKQYVKDNRLDIKQYHAYGWDPVELFPEAAQQNEAANTLPKYVYTGKDMKMKAICDYLVEHETEEMKSHILIPMPDIYDTIKEDGVWKVFGNFGCFYYYKNANTLVKKGGSWVPACFHLKKENGTYTVVKVEKTAESGPEYMEGIRKFCKGHPELFEKFFSGDLNEDWERRKKIEKEILKKYVEDNGLDIR